MDPQKTPLGQAPTDVPGQPVESAQPTDSVAIPAAGATFKPESPVIGPPPVASTMPAAPGPNTPDATKTPSSPSEAETPAAPLPAVADIPPNPLPVAAPKKSKKGLMIGIVAAVLVLLGGGAAASYYTMINSPENVLKQALANVLSTEKAKTMHFSGTADITEKKSNMTLTADFTGASNNENGAFDFSSSWDVLVTKFTLDARSTDGKTYYVRLGGLDGLSQVLSASDSLSGSEAMMLSLYAPMIEQVNNQWIEINESLIKQLTGGSSVKQLSEADRQKLMTAYEQNSFIVIKQKLGDESIKGVASHHYKIGVDKTKLKAFVAAIKAANLEAVKINDDQLKAMNTELDKVPFDKYPVDIWIAKSSKMITQLGLKFSEEEGSFDLRFTVESYNKPVKTEKPAGAKSLLELMGGFMNGLTDTSFNPDDYQLQSGISL